MKKLDSRVLSYVNRVLGISGGAGAAVEVDDANLQQVFDVGPLIRRGRVPASGLFSTGINNTHSAGAASFASGTISPYAAAGSLWPAGVPLDFDVWLVAIEAQLGAVAGNFTAARLQVNFPGGQGLNIAAPVTQVSATSAVIAASSNISITVAEYNAEVSLGANLGVILTSPAEAIRCPLPLRLPRDCTIQWSSQSAAAGASQYRMSMVLGLAAAGLGQDYAG